MCCAGVLAGVAVRSADAQATAASTAIADGSLSPNATNNNAGPSGLIPLERGFNASLISSSQHDSETGWSNLLTPAIAYRFNKYLSADASAPVFTVLNVNAATAVTNGKVATNADQLKTVHGVAGDTALAAHLELPVIANLSYTSTPTLGLPSGNSTFGIGAGQVTYDFNNHFEADFPLSPFVELGFGDTSTLLNRRVKRNQATVGPLAHFEAGGSVDLPFSASFDVSAYESLPIGNQNITATRTVRKKTVTKVTGTTGLAEDNGFNTSLDIPVQRHVTVSGFYTRSLRQHSDTAGFSLTFFARPRHVDNDK